MSQGGPMNKIIFLSLSALMACSVSKTKLTSDGEKVEILLNKPKEECSVVEKIIGMNEQGSVELARNHVRNLAAKADANAVYIEQEIPNGGVVKIFATAYSCR